jgi:hypothetical protein
LQRPALRRPGRTRRAFDETRLALHRPRAITRAIFDITGSNASRSSDSPEVLMSPSTLAGRVALDREMPAPDRIPLRRWLSVRFPRFPRSLAITGTNLVPAVFRRRNPTGAVRRVATCEISFRYLR